MENIMSDQVVVKRVRMEVRNVDFNDVDGNPIPTLVIEIPLVDFTPSEGRISEIWEEFYTNKAGKDVWSTYIARIGDRFGKMYKDLKSLILPGGGTLEGYSLKLSLKAPRVTAKQSVHKPLVEVDDFGGNFAPMGGHSQDIHSGAVGSVQGTDQPEKKIIRANGKK